MGKTLCHARLLLLVFVWITGMFISGSVSSLTLQGPSFLREPPNRFAFHNSSGGLISCTATGDPQPSVYWTKNDGMKINDIPGLRHSRPDGSLLFQPFRAEEYRQDIHDGTYRCAASSTYGSVCSAEVHVKAVVLQEYQAHVYDEYVIHGNTAVFKCQVPNFMKEFLEVVSWSREDGLVIVPHRNAGAKYVMLRDGELHIRNTARTDSFKRYRCRVKNTLTGTVSPSVTSGQLIVTDPTGSISPRVLSSKSVVEVQEGLSVDLPCTAQGYPVPSYTWYRKDGIRLVPLSLTDRIIQMNGSLFMNRALPQDSGKYICVVNNSAGETKVDTELTVYANLSVTLHPRILNLQSGRSATFNCSIRGYPVRRITWMKDCTRLVANNRIRLIANQVLHITSVQREDQGVYQCFVYGPKQALQGSAQIILSEDAPELKSVFNRQVVQPGDRFSLRCIAIGNPLPRVIWSLDTRQIPENHRVQYGDFVSTAGEVVSFVNVSSARAEDGGLYECRAQNEAGHSVHRERVDVAGPPFIRTMTNVTVVDGVSFTYNCPVSGYPLPAITWSKDKREMPFNDRQKVFTNGSFSITDVSRPTDEGTYTCSAKNKQSQKAEKSLYIKVIKRPVINPFFFPKTLTEGMHVVVTCSVLMGDPPITVRWLKDGMTLNRKMLNIEESALGNLGSSLVFSSVGRSHNGNYTCLAENIAGEANYTATMLVNVPPRWRIEPSDVSAVVDEAVIFDCQADGYPQPLIRWKKATGSSASTRNFKSIISNFHIQTLENGSLSVKDVNEDDSGFYLCEAANGVGADLSTVVQLSVHVAAHFKTPFRVHRISKGAKLSIMCEAFGEEPMTLQWFKDKVPVREDSEIRYNINTLPTPTGIQSVLTVSSPTRGDSALYSCSASNAYGKDDTDIQVLVEEVPDPPTDLTTTEVNSRAVTLTWGIPYSGNSPLTKYILHWKIARDPWTSGVKKLELTGTNTTATVSGLQPLTSYHFKIQAENALGKSAFTDVIAVTTEEEVPSDPPRNVEAVAVSSHSIRVMWKPPSENSMNGKIRGYYVGYKLLNSQNHFIYKTLEQMSQSESVTECTITNLRRSTDYVVTVQAFNNKGAGPSSKEVQVRTHENDPPSSPILRIVSATSYSVELSWEHTSGDNSPVKGYKLFYKEDISEWTEVELSASHTSYSLRSLSCGTRFHFHMVAFNDVGRSEPSEIVSVTTQGSAPLAPDKSVFLDVNATFVSLNLDSWSDGGCPITHFSVQYKEKGQREWTLVTNNLEPADEGFHVMGLKPATWYNLMVAAHNKAGTTEAEYVFATLTLTGATLSPVTNDHDEGFVFYRNLTVLVPIVCAVVVLLVITLVVLIVCLKKNRNTDYAHSQNQAQSGDQKADSISMASVGKKLYETPRETLYYPSPYATTRISMYSAESESSSGQTNSLQRTTQMGQTVTRPEHTYDVPFPQKQQFSGQKRYSAPSNDYQALFRETVVEQLLDPGEDDHRQLVIQRMCLQEAKQGSPTFIHQARQQQQMHHYQQQQQHPQQQPQRIYRLNRHSEPPNAQFANTRDYLSDGNSDEDEGVGEKTRLHGSTVDNNHELSEAECDRDYHQHIRKSSQSPFIKFRMSKCGLCIDKE